MALIENGCCPEQRVVRGELQCLSELALREKVVSPALIVVGEVVNLAEQLDWYMPPQPQQQSASSAVAPSTPLQKMSA